MRTNIVAVSASSPAPTSLRTAERSRATASVLIANDCDSETKKTRSHALGKAQAAKAQSLFLSLHHVLWCLAILRRICLLRELRLLHQLLHAPSWYNALWAALRKFPSLEFLPLLLPQPPLGLVLPLALCLLVYPHTRHWPILRILCVGC